MCYNHPNPILAAFYRNAYKISHGDNSFYAPDLFQKFRDLYTQLLAIAQNPKFNEINLLFEFAIHSKDEKGNTFNSPYYSTLRKPNGSIEHCEKDDRRFARKPCQKDLLLETLSKDHLMSKGNVSFIWIFISADSDDFSLGYGRPIYPDMLFWPIEVLSKKRRIESNDCLTCLSQTCNGIDCQETLALVRKKFKHLPREDFIELINASNSSSDL